VKFALSDLIEKRAHLLLITGNLVIRQIINGIEV